MSQLLASHKQSNIEIRRVEMDSLRGLNWLNDEIMNVYVNLLQVCVMVHLIPQHLHMELQCWLRCCLRNDIYVSARSCGMCDGGQAFRRR